MSTFDGWETQLYGDVLALPGQLSDDELMHFRTKGSKNGVRRFQQLDGTWTPLGLKERREREGWGESRRERRAEKQVARSERRAAKAEKRAARIERKANKVAARKQAIAAAKEKKRLKGDISNLTDEELKQKLARVKMELEYKELTKSPVIKTGEKVVSKLIEMRAAQADREAARAQRELENNKVKLDMARTRTDMIKAKEGTKRAKADAEKAKYEMKEKQADVAGGLKIERQTALKRAKIDWKGTTLHGGIIRALNTRMTAGLDAKLKKKREEQGKVAADRIRTKGKHEVDLLEKQLSENERNAEEKKRQEGVKAYEKQQRKLRQERQRTQDAYAARVKKMQEDASKRERQRQEREEQQQRQREEERKKRVEAAERERKKNEKKLQKTYDREIKRYDKTARRMARDYWF